MATVTKPIALDESFNTTEVTPRNIADVLAEGLSHITGRTASEVEYDNTDSGLAADNVQDALDEIAESVPTLPSVDIQTAVDEFSTYNGGLLSECKVALSPNQDLHGYPNPWVGGASKNKLPKIETATISGITFNSDDFGIVRANGTASAAITLTKQFTLPSGQYYFSGCADGGNMQDTYDVYIWNNTDNERAKQFNGTSSVISLVNSTQSGELLIDSSKSYSFIIRIRQNYVANDVVFKPMIRLASESDPTFEPYSNICPISGHTQVEVDVSDGQTTQEQVTVNLGGTYYSGTLDVVSGELTVDSAFIASYNGETLPSTWISDRDVYAVGTTPTTGAEVCYKLATPTPIQLSPTMVKALVGENHLSAPLDGQEITESKYKQMFTFDDVIAYIQSLS